MADPLLYLIVIVWKVVDINSSMIFPNLATDYRASISRGIVLARVSSDRISLARPGKLPPLSVSLSRHHLILEYGSR